MTAFHLGGSIRHGFKVRLPLISRRECHRGLILVSRLHSSTDVKIQFYKGLSKKCLITEDVLVPIILTTKVAKWQSPNAWVKVPSASQSNTE